MQTEEAIHQLRRRTLSPDYLLVFSNEVCMWAWFQGSIHDAHVGTGNRRRNQKLSRDPPQGRWEAFQRGEREQSRWSAIKTLEGLTSLNEWWCFQGLLRRMWLWSQIRWIRMFHLVLEPLSFVTQARGLQQQSWDSMVLSDCWSTMNIQSIYRFSVFV